MGAVRKILLIAVPVVMGIVFWLWWNSPERVDMAGYVPADSIVYIEANSLPAIISGVVSTDAWRALAPSAGLNADYGSVGWLSRLISVTGIGSAESVILSRAQVAVVVLSFGAAEEEAGSTLKIIPRAALVAETHTGERRVRAALEKLVGDFARRAYGSPRVERREVNGTELVSWGAPDNPRRRIVAAVSETVAVVGNDESVVEACLAVRRGERPALVGDAQLEEMRRRMSARDALAFGYIPSGNAAKLLEVALLPVLGQLTSKAQSVAASTLPQLADKALGTAGWSARVRDGAIEDSYFLTLQQSLTARLRSALAEAGGGEDPGACQLLPAGTYQLTRYSYQDPEAAWRGLNAAISSQLDALSAPLVALFLSDALEPYGIESPRDFLRAAGPELVTARLDDAGSSTVTVVEVRDRAALNEQVRRRLGGGARVNRIGQAEMLVSTNPERGAASFTGDRLIIGSAESVRRCLTARANSQTLTGTEAFRRSAGQRPRGDAGGVLTLTNEAGTARSFITYFARQSGGGTNTAPQHPAALERALEQLPYGVSQTQIVEDGMERKTRSAFGRFGELVMRFAPEAGGGRRGEP